MNSTVVDPLKVIKPGTKLTPAQLEGTKQRMVGGVIPGKNEASFAEKLFHIRKSITHTKQSSSVQKINQPGVVRSSDKINKTKNSEKRKILFVQKPVEVTIDAASTESNVGGKNSEAYFKCAVWCGDEKFETSNLLSNHVKEIHKKNRCTVCGKWFSIPNLFKRHNETFHLKKYKIYDCDHCAKTFSTKGALVAHKKVHLKKPKRPKQYSCSLCSFVSLKKCDALQHVKSVHCTQNIEQNKIRFPCYVCYKSFETFSAIKPHLFIHVALGETSESEMSIFLVDTHKRNEREQAERNQKKSLGRKFIKKMLKLFKAP